MKILSVDPGAKRCGWAVLSAGSTDSEKIKCCGSGISGVDRASNPQEPYQQYRLRLIKHWVTESIEIFQLHSPERVVTEIVPAVGGGNFVAATQSMLAATVATTVEAMAYHHGYTVEHLAASTVKLKVGGSGRATKVKVRDGVLKQFPQFETYRRRWTGKNAVWDEVDALAIGIAYLT